VSSPQSPQAERDLRAVDQIFDVPHAQLASNDPACSMLMKQRAALDETDVSL
jgi:hypothetical protein